MKNHNFQPLKACGADSSATGSISIRCVKTGAALPWNEAARAGWVADLNGKAFCDYYSPHGRKQAEAEAKA